MPSQPPIEVVAVVLRAPDGRLLTVRKRGTTRFMLPGGKPEPGEPAPSAAVREVREEIGLVLPEEALTPLGDWEGEAANEPGRGLLAHVYRASDPVTVSSVNPSGEIAELRWLGPEDAGALGAPALAPLLTAHVLPLLQQAQTSP